MTRENKVTGAGRFGNRKIIFFFAILLVASFVCGRASGAGGASGAKVVFHMDGGLLYSSDSPLPILTDRIKITLKKHGAKCGRKPDGRNCIVKEYDFDSLLEKAEKKKDNQLIAVEIGITEGHWQAAIEAYGGRYGLTGKSVAEFDVLAGGSVVLPLDADPAASDKRYVFCESLFRHNTDFSEDGVTMQRWAVNVIPVEGGKLPEVWTSLSEWEASLGDEVRFMPVDSLGGGGGIRFVEGGAVDAQGKPGCGNVEGFETFASMTVHLSPEEFQNCPPRKNIIMHEIGHSLGYIGHSKDGTSIMDDSDSVWRNMKTVDAGTAAMIKKIYQLPAGAKLGDAGCADLQAAIERRNSGE